MSEASPIGECIEVTARRILDWEREVGFRPGRAVHFMAPGKGFLKSYSRLLFIKTAAQ
jgi:hypothetical protein